MAVNSHSPVDGGKKVSDEMSKQADHRVTMSSDNKT